MSQPSGARPSAFELVTELKGKGMSNAEIANELQRDPKMVWKILHGKTSGAAYLDTLTELARDGHASTRPGRRRGKDGHIVPVRAKAGAETKTVIPEDTQGRYVPQPKKGKFESATTFFGEGARQHEVRFPKTKGAKGRAAAVDDLMSKIRGAAKAQRGRDKRVQFSLTFADGRVMEVGSKSGYFASDVLYNTRKHGDNALSWLVDQAKERYLNLDVGAVPITGVTMKLYNAPGLAREADPYKKSNEGKEDVAKNRVLRTGKKRPAFNPKRDLL